MFIADPECPKDRRSIEIGLVAEPAFDRTDVVQHEPQIPLEALNIDSRAHLRIETKVNNKNFGVGVSEVAGCGGVQELLQIGEFLDCAPVEAAEPTKIPCLPGVADICTALIGRVEMSPALIVFPDRDIAAAVAVPLLGNSVNGHDD